MCYKTKNNNKIETPLLLTKKKCERIQLCNEENENK